MLGMDNQITGNVFHVSNTHCLLLLVVDYYFFNVIRNGQYYSVIRVVYNIYQCYQGCTTLSMLSGVYNFYQCYQEHTTNINVIRGIQRLSMLPGVYNLSILLGV